MQQTTNYSMNKPGSGDTVNIADLNANPDILDEKIKEIEDAVTALTERIDDIGGFLAGISGELTSAQKTAIRNELGVSTPAEAITTRTVSSATMTVSPKSFALAHVTCPVVSGYTPVGIVGYGSWDASSGGQNWGYVATGNLNLDNGVASVMLHNLHETANAVVVANFVILYRRNNF